MKTATFTVTIPVPEAHTKWQMLMHLKSLLYNTTYWTSAVVKVVPSPRQLSESAPRIHRRRGLQRGTLATAMKNQL